jgi:hypothetical protein
MPVRLQIAYGMIALMITAIGFGIYHYRKKQKEKHGR